MNSGRCYHSRARAEGRQRIEVQARCTEEKVEADVAVSTADGAGTDAALLAAKK